MSTEIVVHEEATPAAHELVPPKDVMKYAQAAAREIVDVARSGKLLAKVGGREYPMTECMTLIGNMTGHTVKVEWCRPVPEEWGIGKGWEARAVVLNRDGREVAGAESMCLRSEKMWAKRDEFAVRSMAQTRASGKALRLALGYIVTLAGWEALPAEEITDEMRDRPTNASAKARVTEAFPDATEEVADPKTVGRSRFVSLAEDFKVEQEQLAAVLTDAGIKGSAALADDTTFEKAKQACMDASAAGTFA